MYELLVTLLCTITLSHFMYLAMARRKHRWVGSHFLLVCNLRTSQSLITTGHNRTGRAQVLRAAFKLVPYPVLLGFLTSIGVGLFSYALSTVTPSEHSPTGGFVGYVLLCFGLFFNSGMHLL